MPSRNGVFADQLGEVLDRDLLAGAEVDRLVAVVPERCEHDPLGAVVDVEELACGRAVAPEDDLRLTALLCLDHLPDQRRDHVRRLEVEVVSRAVEVDRQQVDRVDAVLLAVRLRADEQRLLGDAVGRVRLLRVALPEVFLAERHGRELRVRAHRAEQDELGHPVQPRLLDHVRAHHQVRVPVAAGIRAVRADAADLGREMDHQLRPCVGEQPLRVLPVRQVVVRAAGDDRVEPLRAEPFDQMCPQEPGTAGDERSHGAVLTVGAVYGSQSTRPSQRSRFSAYHWIVLRMPSSQETCGSQPVSLFSFS
jgi:hypothetical protein